METYEMMRTSRYTTTCLLLAATLCWSFPTSAGARVIGRANNVVPSTVRVSPDGDHVLVVSVDPKTKKRRVYLDGRALPGVYDAIAEGTPSPIPFDEIIETSAVALRVEDLLTGHGDAEPVENDGE